MTQSHVLVCLQPALQSEPAKPASEWKEFTAPDGRKYYHNKATGESKWHNPDTKPAAALAPAAAGAAPGGGPAPVQVSCAALGCTRVPVEHRQRAQHAGSNSA